MLSVQDDNGTAYLAYSSVGNKDMHIVKLTSDFTNVEHTYLKLFIGQSREAPAIFKHGGLYFMLTSGCTGWEPNQALVHYARSANMSQIQFLSHLIYFLIFLDISYLTKIPVPSGDIQLSSME